MRNVETPLWVRERCAGVRGWNGRPTVRGAELPAGQGAQEANAGGRKAAGTRRPQDRNLLRRVDDQLAGYRAWCSEPVRVLTWAGGLLK